MNTGPVNAPRQQAAAGLSPKTPASPSGTPRTVDSQDLLQGHSQLWIRHQGETYRLQATRQGKLILTK